MHAPEKTLAVVDHNVPTSDRSKPNPDPESAEQIAALAQNAKDFGIEYFNEFDKRQGIVHIIGPEQGFTLPGTTIVCGDSHTATHGAFGALAYGIGTSEVEHVLATQTLIQKKSKNMRAVVDGKLPPGVTAKDIILAIIGEIGTAGGTGYALEYAGEAIRAISMEGRMTICNMSVEGGAKAGFIAPDEKAYAYLKDKPKAPKGKAWDEAMRYWETLLLRRGAHFDREIRLDAAKLPPLVTWGTSPEQVVSITGRVPVAAEIADEKKRIAAERSLGYMGLEGRREDHRHQARPRVHRLMHQCAHRGFARGRARRRRQDGERQRLRHDRARLRPGEGAGGSRRARQDFQGRRLRLARAGLLDVPRHESRTSSSRASAAPPPRTATSKAARATRAAPTWCRPPWRRRRRSPAISSTCGSGSNKPCRHSRATEHQHTRASVTTGSLACRGVDVKRVTSSAKRGAGPSGDCARRARAPSRSPARRNSSRRNTDTPNAPDPPGTQPTADAGPPSHRANHAAAMPACHRRHATVPP